MTGAGFGGFVLAGGQSSRMGTDKALLVLNGRTLLETAAHAVFAACGSAVVVGDPRRYARFGYPVIEDAFPGAGPLAGIHAALAASEHEWNLIVACDMPALEAGLLKNVLNKIPQEGEEMALLPVFEGRPQPLCGVYNRRALPRIEGALRAGRFKVTGALGSFKPIFVERIDGALLRNVNTPEEWHAISAN